MKPLMLLLVLASLCYSGSYLLDVPVICEGTDECLQYDDGTACWLTWGGIYRGVWFDITDFFPEADEYSVLYTEFWFYHLNEVEPWDTSNFYSELWNGDTESGPTTRLDQTLLSATHYSPVRAYFSPSITTEADFWGIVNTSLSCNGNPTSPSDGSPNPSTHSYRSDDFIIWEPYDAGGLTDYFIRIGGTCSSAFETGSWGSIKGLYR